MGNGNRQAPAARAHVSDRERRRNGTMFECGLNDQFRFRPWDEHGGRDFKCQAPEYLLPRDVGDRLAPGAACDQGLVLFRKVWGGRFVPVCQETRGVPPEDQLRQKARVKLGLWIGNTRAPELISRFSDTDVDSDHRALEPSGTGCPIRPIRPTGVMKPQSRP